MIGLIYATSTGGGGVKTAKESLVIKANNITQITLLETPISLDVFINEVYQNENKYTFTNNVITVNTPLQNGDIVEVRYYY